MFFCPICNYTLDITKNITAEQKGGVCSDTSTDEKLESILIGGVDYKKIIESVLNNTVTKKDIETINIDNLEKSNDYKKLSTSLKNKIYNKIQDLLPLNKKKLNENNKVNPNIKNAFFICKNCGYNKHIENKTSIFQKTNDTSTIPVLPESYELMIDDPTLPRTIRYICKNKKCITHTNIKKKEAVFFRVNNTYKLRYICVECKTSWII